MPFKESHKLSRRLKRITEVRVSAPSRLHFGLLNESGAFGHVDSGIGIALCEPRWEIDVAIGKPASDNINLPLDIASTIKETVDRLSFLLPTDTISISVRGAIPAHVGLGSKTSMLLSIAKAVAKLSNQDLPLRRLAALIRRGGTSGVGIYAFDRGGFIWDAGHIYPRQKAYYGPSSNALAPPPPLLLRKSIRWAHIIHLRFDPIGIYGAAEVDLFRTHCPLPTQEALKASACVTSLILPAILGKDIIRLNKGILALQEIGLKKIEWSVQSQKTNEFRKYWSRLKRPESVGLSSMGPTVFICTKEPEQALNAIHSFPAKPLHIIMTNIDNDGARIFSKTNET